jgi:hypothetical protein
MKEKEVRSNWWIFLSLLAAFLSIFYTSVRMHMAQAHWFLCFEAHSWDNLPPKYI